MKKRLFIVLLLLTASFYAQKNKTDSEKPPQSIYTFISFGDSKNGFYAIQKKLNLTNFNFVYIDPLDLDYNLFSFDTRNFGKNPSEFVYDEYTRYQNNNLWKDFLRRNDPTRRPWQCF